MLIVKSKIVVVTLILMALIGQAASATNISCPMGKNMTAHCMTSTDHASPIVKDKDGCGTKSKSTMSKSCEQNRNCASSDFASAILSVCPVIGTDMSTLQKKSESTALVIKQAPTTLYRPPISL